MLGGGGGGGLISISYWEGGGVSYLYHIGGGGLISKQIVSKEGASMYMLCTLC